MVVGDVAYQRVHNTDAVAERSSSLFSPTTIMHLSSLLAKLPTSLLVTSLALAVSALPVESTELTVLTPDNFSDTVAQGAWYGFTYLISSTTDYA